MSALAGMQLVLPLVALLVCGLFLWPAASRWAYDDPYITYRYAENLWAGVGFVYNANLRVLSTTTPGYTLLLAGLAGLWPNLPLLSNGIGLLAILLCGLFVTLLLPNDLGQLGAALVALLLVLLPPAYRALGSEMPFYTLLVLASLLLTERGLPFWAGALAGLATITRPDGALAAVAVVVWFMPQPRRLVMAALGVALTSLPWYLFAFGYFGSLIPVTLAAKQAQLAQIAGSAGFWQRLVQTLVGYAGSPWFWPALLCIGYGLVALVRERRVPLVLAWALLYAASYSALGVSGYHWYIVPLFPALVWCVGYGLWALRRDVAGLPLLSTLLVPLLLAAPLVGAALELSLVLRRAPEPRAVVYTQVGTWLAAHTPPQATIGAFEVGIIGYYSQRPMVDFAGLIQPDVARAPGVSYVDWADTAIHRYQPDFVVLPDQAAAALRREPWFAADYRPLRTFRVPDYDGPLVIYERR